MAPSAEHTSGQIAVLQAAEDELRAIANGFSALMSTEARWAESTQRFARWKARTADAIRRVVSAHEAQRFADRPAALEKRKAFDAVVRDHAAWLAALREEIARSPARFPDPAESSAPAPAPSPARGPRAFLAHGHDHAALEAVARFLAQIGVEPVILHERASGGRTIIEMLEHYADVDFAVVLLTPDDVGASRDAPDRLEPRARQNVVAELGYFVGKLGRRQVCALCVDPLAVPSDFSGVRSVPFDRGGGWRVALARELRAAGFAIDMNRLG